MEFCLAQLEVPCIIHSWRCVSLSPTLSLYLALSICFFVFFTLICWSLSLFSSFFVLVVCPRYSGTSSLRTKLKDYHDTREAQVARTRFMNFNEIPCPRWKLLRISLLFSRTLLHGLDFLSTGTSHHRLPPLYFAHRASFPFHRSPLCPSLCIVP